MEDAPKFSDVSPDIKVKISELYNLVSGQRLLADGCKTGICSKKINVSYCEGGAICTSGIAGTSAIAE